MKSLRTSALEVDARVIKDSRGDDTVEATVRLGSHSGTASVPAGKTKGGDEAVAVPAAVAVTTVKETIASLLRSTDADLASHAGLLVAERALLERGGENRRDLGANAMLPVSIALWRCAASIAGTPLWRYIRTNEPELASTARVRLFSNVLNGGYHALKAGETLGHDQAVE